MTKPVLEEGPTEVSGVDGEAECPTDHWDLATDADGKVIEPCYTCKAAV